MSESDCLASRLELRMGSGGGLVVGGTNRLGRPLGLSGGLSVGERTDPSRSLRSLG